MNVDMIVIDVFIKVYDMVYNQFQDNVLVWIITQNHKFLKNIFSLDLYFLESDQYYCNELTTNSIVDFNIDYNVLVITLMDHNFVLNIDVIL